ncbi:MAG: TIM barrel protein, partial [Patescibacteria group bacterium]
KKAVTKVFDDFDRIVGTKYLRMSHLNDSKVDIGERKDRHEDIGVGKIGIAGFEAIFSDKRLKDLSFVLETPGDMEKDLRIIKEMRKKLVK